ncbi:hypothetical protein T484DRAFT_1782601, partial [Baffinella frigidus]
FATSFRSVTSFGGSPDFSKVKVLFTAAFSIVDSRGVVAIPAKRKEALRLVELRSQRKEALRLVELRSQRKEALRSQALKLMIRMLDIRANFRISDMVVEGKNPRGRKPTFVGLKLAQAGRPTTPCDGPKEVDLKALGDRFEPYREIFNQCMQRCYKQQIVSSDELKAYTYTPGEYALDQILPELKADTYAPGEYASDPLELKADTYAPGEYASDPLVEAMIGLMGFQDANLTAQ